jgi:hypothetical protein
MSFSYSGKPMLVKDVEALRVELNGAANNIYLLFLQHEFKNLLAALPPESELPKDFLLRQSTTHPLCKLLGLIKPMIERTEFPAALRIKAEAFIANHSISNDRAMG